MERLFVFCNRGIIHGMTVAGNLKFSWVTVGFTKLPQEEQKSELIEAFQEKIKEYSGRYKILFMINEGRKKYLQNAIQKHVKYIVETYSHDGYLYWEGIDVYSWDFDEFNKVIVAEL